MVSNGLPILEHLATAMATNESPERILSVANDIRRPLGWMLKASTNLGYFGLNARIEDMLEALPTSAHFSHADGEQMVDAIVDLRNELEIKEKDNTDLQKEIDDHLGYHIFQLWHTHAMKRWVEDCDRNQKIDDMLNKLD